MGLTLYVHIIYGVYLPEKSLLENGTNTELGKRLLKEVVPDLVRESRKYASNSDSDDDDSDDDDIEDVWNDLDNEDHANGYYLIRPISWGPPGVFLACYHHCHQAVPDDGRAKKMYPPPDAETIKRFQEFCKDVGIEEEPSWQTISKSFV